MKKRISIIGTNGLPGRYGGWDQLLEHFTKLLQEDFEIVVFKSKNHPIKGLKEYNGARLYTLPFKANGAQSVIYDIYSMFLSVLWRQDVLVVLGTSGCICFPLLRLFGVKTVLNPDGAEWKRTKWNSIVQKFLYYSEKVGVKNATRVISDNKVIHDSLKSDYKVESDIIAYGGNHVIKKEGPNVMLSSLNINPDTYAFKVCRIVPENNIDLILEAFSKLNVNLIIVGNWDNSAYGIATKVKYSQYRNIHLLDPIYDQDKLDSLRSNCRYYIHGHSVGGTNPSLVEAMSLGLCCIVFGVNYNMVTTDNLALYFDDSQELVLALSQLESDESLRDKIKSDLEKYARVNYNWSKIISGYKRAIDEVIA